MKTIKQRIYTRNGIIFKTIEGKRYKFSNKIKRYFKVSKCLIEFTEFDDIIQLNINKIINNIGLNYSCTKIVFTQLEDDFIQDIITVIITLER